MHGREKSDPAIVATKPPNEARTGAEEAGEPRAGAKGKADQQSTRRALNRESVSQALDRLRQAARQRKKERFTALLHHINLDLLRMAFLDLKRTAAPGVDGLTWQDYEADLEPRLRDLHDRVHRGAYRALPSRRRYIPKADGRARPLAIAALEDKIVQRATVIQRKNTTGYRAMGSAQGEAAVRTVVATARLKAGPSTFGTVLSTITAGPLPIASFYPPGNYLAIVVSEDPKHQPMLLQWVK